jgi:predicted N-formylglutamate amidohydrolase
MRTEAPPAADSPYVELVDAPARGGRRGAAAGPVLLLCDHAGKEVPGGLEATLGIGEAMLARHIGWDIGAADLTRSLARRLGAAAILNHCSRLVIDPNRRPGGPTSVPAVSDGCVIPGNQGLDEAALCARVERYFVPYHRAIARRIGAHRRRGEVPAVISVHSYTPRMDGEDRPWQVGVLWRHDRRIAGPALAALRARGDLVVGDNQPYSGLGEFGFTVEFHTQRTRLPHVMFEVRQDEIDTPAKAERWAAIVAESLAEPLADPGLYALLPKDDLPDTPGLEGFSWRHGSRL